MEKILSQAWMAFDHLRKMKTKKFQKLFFKWSLEIHKTLNDS